MLNNLSAILEKFDERFDNTYYGKDENNTPNYIQDNAKKDIKTFIQEELKERKI